MYFYLHHRSVSASPPRLLSVESLTFSSGGNAEPRDLRSACCRCGSILTHSRLTHSGAHICTSGKGSLSSFQFKFNLHVSISSVKLYSEAMELQLIVQIVATAHSTSVSLFGLFMHKSLSPERQDFHCLCCQHLLRQLRFRLLQNEPGTARGFVCMCFCTRV